MKTKVSNRVFSLLMAVFMVLLPVAINVHAEDGTIFKESGILNDP